MSALTYDSGAAFRRQLAMRVSLIGTGAAVIVAFYMLILLQFDEREWSHFLWLVAFLAATLTPGLQLVQRRLEAAIVNGIDRELDGTAGPEDVRRAFAVAVDLPRRMFAQTVGTWLFVAVAAPIWMWVAAGPLETFKLMVLAVAPLSGGAVIAIFVALAVKQLVRPLRTRWADRIDDPDERARLVTQLSLRLKLGVAVSLVVSVTAGFSLLMAYGLSSRPIQSHASRIQANWLVGATNGLAQGGGVAQARLEASRLGIAAQVFLLDLESGQALGEEGVGGLLSEDERLTIARSPDSAGTSSGLGSVNVFAWRRIPGDDGRALVAVMPASDILQDLSGITLAFAWMFASCLAMSACAAHLLAGDVSRATERLRVWAERIADGDLTGAVTLESEDEMGELARAFQRMSSSLRSMVAKVASTADGLDAAAQGMTGIGGSVAEATAEQVTGLERATTSMASINQQVSGITESAQALSGNSEEASSSVLELGAASEELNQTASALNGQVEEVTGSIEQMIQSVRQIAEGTESLGEAVSETSASMSEMASAMAHVDENASETARLSARVVEIAEDGRDKVQRTISGMDAIREATDAAQTVIGGLNERVGEIGAIVDVIDDVADETNLLALNAAIIAAQAGEQGRAFSVVADEIKDLADRVLSSTKEIGSLIRAVQSESANAAQAIERGADSVQGGVDLSAQAGVALEEITSAARGSGGRIAEIVQAVREQARASGHVSELMERVQSRVEDIRNAGREQERGNQVVMRGSVVMRDVAQQTQRTTEEQSRGAMQIRESVEGVREAVDRIHAALQEQSEACRLAVSFLEQVHVRTLSNDQASQELSRATAAIERQAEVLREDVRRFRI